MNLRHVDVLLGLPIGKANRLGNDGFFRVIAKYEELFFKLLPLLLFCQQHYQANPEDLELDWQRETEVMPNAFQDHQKYDDYFALADAYANGLEELFNFYPPEPTAPPEVSDFISLRSKTIYTSVAAFLTNFFAEAI